MLLICLLLGEVLTHINVDIAGTTIYIRGDGEITRSDVRSQGDFKTITDIIIEDGPTKIVSGSFHSMTSLQAVYFSKTIESLEDNTFYQNPKLNSFTVDKESKFLYTDGKLLYNFNRTIFYKAINRPGDIILDPNTNTLMTCSMSSCSFHTITIPSKVKSAGYYIFIESTVYEVKYEENSLLTTIPWKMYQYSKITKLHVAASVTTISSDAFSSLTCEELIFDDINNSNCTTLMPNSFENSVFNVKLPPKITSLPENCFRGSKIISINIPRDCEHISTDAFLDCTDLVEMTVDEDNKAYKMIDSTLYNINETQIVFISPNVDTLSISSSLELISLTLVQTLDKVSIIKVDEKNKNYSSEDGCLYNKNKSILIGVCGGVKQLNISEATELIGDSACIGVNITSVNFRGHKVKSISKNAFKECSNLTHIDLAESIVSLSDSAFQKSGIKSINLKNVAYLGDYCFAETPLSNVTITKSLSNSGSNVFRSCNRISNITFDPDIQITEIFNSMFIYAGKYRSKLQIPKSVKIIRASAFTLSGFSITFEEDSMLDTIETLSFDRCSIIGEFELPSSLKHIESYSFSGCIKLTELIFMGDCKLQTLGKSAFKGCSSLKSFYVPSTLQRFDYSMFF